MVAGRRRPPGACRHVRAASSVQCAAPLGAVLAGSQLQPAAANVRIMRGGDVQVTTQPCMRRQRVAAVGMHRTSLRRFASRRPGQPAAGPACFRRAGARTPRRSPRQRLFASKLRPSISASGRDFDGSAAGEHSSASSSSSRLTGRGSAPVMPNRGVAGDAGQRVAMSSTAVTAPSRTKNRLRAGALDDVVVFVDEHRLVSRAPCPSPLARIR